MYSNITTIENKHLHAIKKNGDGIMICKNTEFLLKSIHLKNYKVTLSLFRIFRLGHIFRTHLHIF